MSSRRVLSPQETELMLSLWEEVPELCRPHERELDRRHTIGCAQIATLLALTVQNVTRGKISESEAYEEPGLTLHATVARLTQIILDNENPKS